MPIYTVDFRKGTRQNPKHFTVPEYADRSYFDVNKTPPSIKLDAVSVEDEGFYRCNIEFRRLRTETRIVKLNILSEFDIFIFVIERIVSISEMFYGCNIV